jgi:hypothetical protein
MSRKHRHGARPSTDHRPAIWPWVLMPLAALALFVALRAVRHSTAMVRSQPAAAAVSASPP